MQALFEWRKQMAKKIGIVLALDGEKEFTQALTNANKSLQVTRSESAKVKAEFESQQNTLAALTAKHEVLTRKLDEQKQKQEAASRGLANAKENYSAAEKNLEELRKALEKATTKQEEMTKSGTASKKELSDQAKEVKDYTVAVSKQETELGKCENKVKNWQQKLNTADKELIETNRAVNKNAAYMKEAQQATNQCATSIDKFGKEVKEAGVVTTEWGEKLKSALINKAVDIAGNALQALASKAVEAGKALVEMATDAAAYADEILTASDVTRMSTDDLQAYSYAAELIDTSLETLTKSMAKNVKSMDSARKGSASYVEAYKKLGVEVTDANGNFRDSETVYWECIDALHDMKDETERDAISMQLFGKSAQDLNPLITKGSDAVKKLKDEAKEMGAVLDGETLQALGETDDSLQRLGQTTEIFKRTVGAQIAPIVQGAAELATGIIRGLTEAISPAKDELQEFIDQIDNTLESSKNSLTQSQETIGATVSEVGELEHYKNVIVDLNEKEQLNEYQKYQLKNAVYALKDSIPELAAAYDEETGKIKLQKDEINNLIKAKQEQVIQNAKAKAEEQALSAVYDAELAKSQADAAKQAAEARRVDLQNEEKELNELKDQYNSLYAQLEDQANHGTPMSADEINRTIGEMDKIREKLEQHGVTLEDVSNKTGTWVDVIENGYNTVNAEIKETTKQAETAGKTLEEAQNQYVGVAAAIDDATEKTIEFTDTVDKNAQAIEKAGDATEDLTETTEEQTQAEQEAAEAAAKQAEAVKNAAEASKNAVADAWESLKDKAVQSITFSMFAQFDGGDDLTTEKMNAALDSQLEGYKKYAENLAKMREYVAQGIISPEFFANLEQQGTSAANEINHMVWTIENQGEYGLDQVKSLSDKWTESLNWQDLISSIIAGDQTALTDALKSLGSTDAEFDALKDAVSSGLDGAGDEMKERIQNLIDTAQEMGTKIPDGLTDAINNSDITPDQLEDRLNSAISGTLDGLMQIAEDQGVQIPEGLAAAIEDGTVDVQEAYEQLLSSISSDLSIAQEMKETGGEAATSYGEGVSEKTQEVVDAVEEVVTAASDTASEKASAFHSTGEEAATQYAEGLLAEKGTISAAAIELAFSGKNAITNKSGSFKTAGETLGSKVAEGITGKKSDISSAGNEAAQAGVAGVGNGVSGAHSVGLQISDGVASGIANGSGEVASAGRRMIDMALAAMKAEAQIHSPSVRFREIVGKNIGKGTALGIALSTKDTEKAAQTMIEKTIQAARKVAKQAWTGDDLEYLWATVTEKAIADNFGVTRKVTKSTTTKNGKKTTKKTKESDDSYYGNILSAAQTYFNQLSIYQTQTTKSEITYWTNVTRYC